MDNYLNGRGGNDNLDTSESDNSFRPLLGESDGVTNQHSNSDNNQEPQGQVEVIFDEKDCPKVEVISVDNKPSQIVVHLPDGRLLKINCEYPV